MYPKPVRPWPVYAHYGEDDDKGYVLLGTVRASNPSRACDVARRKFPKRSYKGAHLSVPLDPDDKEG